MIPTMKQAIAAAAALAEAKATLARTEERLGVPHVELDLRNPVFKPAPLPADRSPRRIRGRK